MLFDDEVTAADAESAKRRSDSLDQLSERLEPAGKRQRRYDPPITVEQLQTCLAMATDPGDRAVAPYYYLRRTRALIGCTDWTRRDVIERHIELASTTVAELCCIACSLLLYPFDRPLESPNQVHSLRLRIRQRIGQLAAYVHSMRPETFYETSPSVFDRPDGRIAFERLATKFSFGKQLGRGAHAVAVEVTPDVPLESRTVRAVRAALKISASDTSGASVHAEVTRYLCRTPEGVFAPDQACGIVRLYYACRDTEIDMRQQRWCSTEVAAKLMGDSKVPKDFSLTIMELCEHDFARFAVAVPRVALDEKFFASVLGQVLCTLDALGPLGFVHGDLHSSNVLLRRLADFSGSEVLRYERQRLCIPAHYSSGYVAKISDFDFARTGKSHRAPIDVNLLACSLLAQIYGLAQQRKVALAEVSPRVVSTLRCLIAPSTAHTDPAMAEQARIVELEATTEEASLKKYQSDQLRREMIERVLNAALKLMRAPFKTELGTTADAALRLPLFDVFREINPHLAPRAKILTVSNGSVPVIPAAHK